jgi:hypothetical protein
MHNDCENRLGRVNALARGGAFVVRACVARDRPSVGLISRVFAAAAVFGAVALFPNVSQAEFIFASSQGARAFAVQDNDVPLDTFWGVAGSSSGSSDNRSRDKGTSPARKAPQDQVPGIAADSGTGGASAPTVENSDTGGEALSGGSSPVAVERASGKISVFEALFPPNPIPLGVLDPPKNCVAFLS